MSLCHYCDWINFDKTSPADIKPSRGKPSVTDTASQHALSSLVVCLDSQKEFFSLNSILLEPQTSKWSFTTNITRYTVLQLLQSFFLSRMSQISQ